MDAVQRVGSELAMHVVAAKPLFLTKEAVTSEALGNERDILRSQVPFGISFCGCRKFYKSKITNMPLSNL